jgi:flagellar biogenesis protein FliO
MPRIGADMLEKCARRAQPMVTACIALALILGGAMAVQARQVGANGPVSLPEPAPNHRSEPATPYVSGAGDATGASGAVASTPADAPVKPIAPPVSESRPLGKPNSMLSSRPVDQEMRDVPAAGALGGSGAAGSEFTRVLGALAAVVGLILLARIVVVRYFPNLLRFGGSIGSDRPSGVIEVLARYPLPGAGRGQQLIVLKVARRVLLAHQAGSNVRTLSEMSDPNEVAALLARLEAGANEKSQQKFRATLEHFESEHEVVLAKQSRAGAALAATQTEIIDLTRTPSRGPGGVVRARRLLR